MATNICEGTTCGFVPFFPEGAGQASRGEELSFKERDTCLMFTQPHSHRPQEAVMGQHAELWVGIPGLPLGRHVSVAM